MIQIPELLIVIGALSLAAGYVLVMRHILERAERSSAAKSGGN